MRLSRGSLPLIALLPVAYVGLTGSKAAPKAPVPQVSAAPSPAPIANGFDSPDDDAVQEYVSDPLGESIARLFVSRQDVDLGSPWRKESVEQHQLLAAVVAPGKLLVPASAVLDATFIEASHFGDSLRHEVVTEFVDQEANLALLRFKEPAAAGLFQPLTVAGQLPIRSQFDQVSWQGGQLTRLKSRLVDIGIRKAQTSVYDVATYVLDTASVQTSAPLVRHGQLAGIVYENGEGVAYAVPGTLLKHFLDDALSGHYRGFATLGVETQPLVSPDSRRLYGAKDAAGGARIAEVATDSKAGLVLRTDDVLLKVAGHELDDYGRYKHPSWGRVSFKYLMNELHAGDSVPVTVLRAGIPLTFDVPLQRHDSRQALDRPPARVANEGTYLIFGGLLFQELDRTYLEAWGPQWRDAAPIELVHTLRRERHGSTSAVVLSRVLADEFNHGYEDLANLLVSQINGRPISTLAEAREAFGTPVNANGKTYAVIKLAFDQGLVVLGYDSLLQAQGRIAQKFGANQPEAFYAPP